MGAFLQNKYVTLTLLVFTVAILTAKDIFIVHEETLVLLCFILFLIFIYTLLKDMLVSAFNDRASLIEKEFNDAYLLKEKTLELLTEHHKKQVSLLEDMNNILLFTKSELHTIVNTRQAALKTRLQTELKNKLNFALKKEDAFFQYIQQTTNHIVMTSVLANLSGAEGTNFKDACFEEGIRVIEQEKETSE